MESFKRSYLTLLLLSMLDREEMYGYKLCQVVKERTRGQRELKAGTVYPLLHILEEHQLIKGEWRIDPDGKRRRYFRLTEQGRGYFRQEKEARADRGFYEIGSQE